MKRIADWLERHDRQLEWTGWVVALLGIAYVAGSVALR